MGIRRWLTAAASTAAAASIITAAVGTPAHSGARGPEATRGTEIAPPCSPRATLDLTDRAPVDLLRSVRTSSALHLAPRPEGQRRDERGAAAPQNELYHPRSTHSLRLRQHDAKTYRFT